MENDSQGSEKLLSHHRSERKELAVGYSGEVLNRTEKPLVLKSKDGTLVAGTDFGVGKEENEDAILVDSGRLSFAAIDGMGGMGQEGDGKKAAKILLKEIHKSFVAGEDISIAQNAAQKEMMAAGIESGGACYLSARIVDNKLIIDQAGDVKLIIIDKNGELKHQTTDEKSPKARHAVVNAVQGKNAGRTTHSETAISTGDRIIMGSDGLWDMFSTDEESIKSVVDNSKGKTAEEAFLGITRLAKERMTSRLGKRDNIGVIVFDYMNESAGASANDIAKKPETAENNSRYFKPSTKVRVKRTSGEIDNDWDVLKYENDDPDPLILVKKDRMTKTVRESALISINATEMNRVGRFELGADVTIVRNSGDVETSGWQLIQYKNSQTGELYCVVRNEGIRATKEVKYQLLSNWNRDKLSD